MTSFGPVKRPSSTLEDSSSMTQKDSSSMESLQKGHHGYNFKFTCPFGIPSTPESAAIRIVKNLVSFGLYYLYFVYIVLFIALIPQRKVSLVYLVGMREIGFLFLHLLRAFPKHFLLNQRIFKSFVLLLLCVASGVELILTRAGIHLLITSVSAVPVILVHATLWREDINLFIGDVGSVDAEEIVPIIILGDDA